MASANVRKDIQANDVSWIVQVIDMESIAQSHVDAKMVENVTTSLANVHAHRASPAHCVVMFAQLERTVNLANQNANVKMKVNVIHKPAIAGVQTVCTIYSFYHFHTNKNIPLMSILQRFYFFTSSMIEMCWTFQVGLEMYVRIDAQVDSTVHLDVIN